MIDTPDRARAREITARQIADAPLCGPVPVMYADEAERQLRDAGRCWYQTGGGLTGFEYCGHPAEPGTQTDEEPGTEGMCGLHARQVLGIDDDCLCDGDRVYDPDPEADPGWLGTVTFVSNNGYRVRWDGQLRDCDAAYGEIALVVGEDGSRRDEH